MWHFFFALVFTCVASCLAQLVRVVAFTRMDQDTLRMRKVGTASRLFNEPNSAVSNIQTPDKLE